MDMQPLKFYKFPGGKEMLTTCFLIDPEEITPARPYVRQRSYSITVKLNCERVHAAEFAYTGATIPY